MLSPSTALLLKQTFSRIRPSANGEIDNTD